MPTPVVGIGRVYLWDGGALLIGTRAGVTDVHAHHAIQVTLAAAGSPVRFRAGGSEQWRDYAGAIIPSHRPHAFDGRQGVGAHIFVEPETPHGRALRERYVDGTGEIARIPDDRVAAAAPLLFSEWEATRDAARLTSAAHAVVGELTAGVEPRRTVDERVLRAIDYIKRNIERPLSLDDVASAACLSPSRFRHLFVQETGMALRPYLLWLRFQRVWAAVGAGATLGAAAHDAGFADSAHFTRTCRRMFGIAPTALRIEG